MQVKQIESQFANSNTFVVFNSKKSRAIIIDAGAEIEKVESVLNGAKVLGIFLTHSHYDHISSLHKYIEKFNCNIYLHEKALERLMDENLNLSVFFGVNYNLKGVAFKSITVSHEEIITIKNFNDEPTNSITSPTSNISTNSTTNLSHEIPTQPNPKLMNNSSNSNHDHPAPQSSIHSSHDTFAQPTHNQPNHEINCNDLQVRAIEAKGHSSCSLLYLFNDTLFSGDVLFDTSIGRYDFEENGKKEMLNSLKMLQNLKEYDKVYCGHGNASSFEKQTRNILVHINYLERH